MGVALYFSYIFLRCSVSQEGAHPEADCHVPGTLKKFSVLCAEGPAALGSPVLKRLLAPDQIRSGEEKRREEERREEERREEERREEERREEERREEEKRREEERREEERREEERREEERREEERREEERREREVPIYE
ncbi:uncharacterized protein K444DRAFT_709712 [Hyaloscypha bicolor E]|uniref:Uncharacterized protein n=1 Tax=Hyaloscypha bicolor E TaxID=1095630 RepID=A0A2J6SHF9_9HELO|nr:uncharacterized protein K444DRAFT_709712 [Hyaloscypha bicolor E]PMD50199.1 hypothetical protein K444DRAFT_709712 [Hyaloscypha bicolor E]